MCTTSLEDNAIPHTVGIGTVTNAEGNLLRPRLTGRGGASGARRRRRWQIRGGTFTRLPALERTMNEYLSNFTQ